MCDHKRYSQGISMKIASFSITAIVIRLRAFLLCFCFQVLTFAQGLCGRYGAVLGVKRCKYAPRIAQYHF